MQNEKKNSTYNRTKKRALKRKPFLRTDGNYPSREEAHSRANIRSHVSSDSQKPFVHEDEKT